MYESPAVYVSSLYNSLIPTCSNSAASVTGTLRGPENLYENVTAGAFNKLERHLPASKGEVQDNNAAFEAYKNETTTIINALVSEVNALTPVRASTGRPARMAMHARLTS